MAVSTPETIRPKEASKRQGVEAMRVFCTTIQSGTIDNPTDFIHQIRQFVKHKKDMDGRLRKSGEKTLKSLRENDQTIISESLKDPLLELIINHRFRNASIDATAKKQGLSELEKVAEALGLMKDLQIAEALGKVSRERRLLLKRGLTVAGLGGLAYVGYQNRQAMGDLVQGLSLQTVDAAPATIIPKGAEKPIPPAPVAAPPVRGLETRPASPTVPPPKVSPSPSPEASPPAVSSPTATLAPNETATTIPTQTLEPPPTPTPPAETEKVPESETISPVFKELFRMLYPIAEQRRKDKMALEPGSEKRINERLNDGRVNIFLYGIGSEGFLVDSIMVISIAEEGPMYQISLPRDLASPRGYALTGRPNTRINEVLHRGGIDEMRKELEMATGLWGDFGVRVNYNVLIDLVNGVDGTIDVNLEHSINDPDGFTKLDERGISIPDPFFIEAGEHTVDGETAQKIARSRKGSSATDYKRAEMQQKVMMWTLQTWAKRAMQDPRKLPVMIENFRHLMGEEIKLGKLKTDFDIETLMKQFTDGLLKNVASPVSLARMAKDAIQNLWNSGEVGLLDLPPSKGMVIGPEFVELAGFPDDVWVTKIKGADVTTDDPQNNYWGKIRDVVENFIKPKGNNLK